MQFTWVAFYEELANKIAAFRERQGELIDFLEGLRKRGFKVTPIEDKGLDGNHFRLTEIDPFTFLGSLNRGLRQDQRIVIAEEMRERFVVDAAAPSDFDGIPVLNNQNSWFVANSVRRQSGDVAALWDIYEAALQPEPFKSERFKVAFDRAVAVHNVNVNLTQGLFWIRPRIFVSLDSTLRALTGVAIPREGLSFDFYRTAVNQIRAKHGDVLALSAQAWRERQDSEASVDPEPVVAEDKHVWLIALGENSDQWDECYRDGVIAIGWNELGDLRDYGTLDAIRGRLLETRQQEADPKHAGLACWEFARVMRPGDDVYVKRGRRLIVGYGVVASEYRHVPGRVMAHVRDVKWQQRGEWIPREKSMTMKTLTDIGKYPQQVQEIRRAMERVRGAVDEVDRQPTPYAIADALNEVFVEESQLRDWLNVLSRKKNVILSGPPGVGKTFLATRLAHLLIQSADETVIERVQFHPSYSYEDFVQGLRPVEGQGFAFRRTAGPFLNFCRRAAEAANRPHVLIVDEINRGNVSKIFGELFSLIEADKRDPRYGVTLAYSREGEERFHVPPNLYVIGMMNTADRSISLVDYALRRRFAFVDVEPAFGSERFAAALRKSGVAAPLLAAIKERMGRLNDAISEDRTLGKGFRVGHSYFCPHEGDQCSDSWFESIVKYELEPLVREYWHDDDGKVTDALRVLRGG